MSTAQLAALQMTSGPRLAENLEQAAELIQQAVEQGAKLVVLPENFALMSDSPEDKLSIREKEGEGPIQAFLAKTALQQKIWLVGGSFPLYSQDRGKAYNACPIYNDKGEQIACYKKIHLFDAKVKPGLEVYEESRLIEAGSEVVAVKTPYGVLGVAICYDLRFPELFRQLAWLGAEIIAVPTAFTVKTGEAHWEVLMRARAIENFCYLVGACQTGTHESGRQTYGHSLIIDPWGTVLSSLQEGRGVVKAAFSNEHLQQIRQDFPVHQHRRLGLEKPT